MDVWGKMELSLAAIKAAGRELVGEELKPESYGGGPSKAQQIAAYQRAERIRKWALSWKERWTLAWKRGKP